MGCCWLRFHPLKRSRRYQRMLLNAWIVSSGFPDWCRCRCQCLLVLALAVLLGVSLKASEITVAAAADLKFALDELVREYGTNQPGITVRVTYGSSGNFYTQLQNRAPFDLYFSADIEYPRKLVKAGFSADTNAFVYGVGRLVIWVPRTSPLNVETLGAQSLLAATVKKVAIANPKHAPYGVAAVAAMKSLQVYDRVEPNLVFGDTVGQAAQFIQSGAADIGIIARSLAIAPPLRDQGYYWEIPLDAYPTMEQGGVILKWAKYPDAARDFRDFVLGPPGRALLKRHGFSLPEN